jgi:hypothetical protein
VTTQNGLLFVDEYTRIVAAPPDRTWTVLHQYVDRLTSPSSSSLHRLPFRILGTVPRSGFEVVDTEPPREIVLGGRHRFSTYRLVFHVEPEGDGSRLRAVTYAAFPGPHGWAYRTLLMVSTGHRRAVERMLRTVAGQAER